MSGGGRMMDDELHQGIKLAHDLARAALARAERAEARLAALIEALIEALGKRVYERPYELRREADGYCTHFNRESPGCGTYPTRPAPCRIFDCRGNPNVWIDFENKNPVPMAPPLFQIRQIRRK